MLTNHPSTSTPNDSMAMETLPDKRKFPIEISVSQTPNLNTNPNNEGFVGAKKAKLSPDDEIVTELKKKPENFNVEAVCWTWEKGERVPFMFIAKALEAIMSNESDTAVITGILCNVLRTVIETTPDDLLAVVYLFSERMEPPHVKIDTYLGRHQMHLAIAEACRTDIEHILKHSEIVGDLGIVANARLPVRKQDKPLTAVKVFETFKKLTKTYGSKVYKKDFMKELFAAASGCEPLYLVYMLQRMLHRCGKFVLAEQTLLAALGHAALYSRNAPANVVNPLELEKAAKVVKEVYLVVPVYDKIVPGLLLGDVWKLPEICTITPGIPFKAMVPKRIIGSVSEIFDKIQDREFICEYEYPGERSLIHYKEDGENGVMNVYDMYADRTTGKYLDVVLALSRLKQRSVKSFILDCQLVAFDRENNKILPLETRGICRKINKPDYNLQLCVFAFDILYLNGEQLLDKQLKVRREHLHQSFQEQSGVLQFATASPSTDPEAIKIFLDEAVKFGCPRLIIKRLTKDATYEPAKSSENWLQLEKDYVKYVPPSLNLVPIAAYHFWERSNGNPTLLLAAYDNVNDEFQAFCHIGRHFYLGRPTAIPGEYLDRLQSKVISKAKPNYKYIQTMRPDVYTWFEPTEVWEVKIAGFTIFSGDRTTIGTVDPIKGIHLLCPRVIRVLEDKNLKEVTTPDKVVELYKASKGADLRHISDKIE